MELAKQMGAKELIWATVCWLCPPSMRYYLKNNNRWHLLHLALNSLYSRTLFLQVGSTKWSHLRSHQQPWNISVTASRFSERPWNFSERPLRSRSLPWNIPITDWCDTWCDHWCDYATRKWLLKVRQLSARCKRCGYIMISHVLRGSEGDVLLEKGTFWILISKRREKFGSFRNSLYICRRIQQVIDYVYI